MQPFGLNDIREKFLSFFQSKGSLRLPSFPLVPQGDASLLLINSGMAPLKPYFSGELPPPQGNRRVTTCQKCIRTPDIERVGKTSRHGTFFEMLGNFSFGDYFKSEACAWAWEFCTDVMKLPVDKLYVTVYDGEDGGIPDDEAYGIWTKEVGVDPSHVSRLGKADNFWEIGAGPCGPCSEIYFDRGEKYGCGDPNCAPGCDCDRYVEFWNLVFTQFNNDGNNNYTPLSQKNIDTGMGLERIACIVQGVESLFDVDTIMNITNKVSEITGAEYGQSESVDVSLRVITDHIRSTTMMICDGVLPSNEGRGYVLRRLLRRAARHGKLLGVSKPFLFGLCETVIDESANAYPELAERRAQIVRVIKAEEERFSSTIDAGMKILMELIDAAEKANVKILSGADCFKLYDTFGFPIDLTREILEERGMSPDMDGFNTHMTEQRERARAATAALGEHGWKHLELGLPKEEKTVFTGYNSFEETDAVVRAIGSGWCVLDKTPFYAEKGGQIADTGTIAGYTVTNVRETKDGKYLHLGEFETGTLAPGDKVTASIDVPRRLDIMRAHSSAHLLQAALRKVLGSHIEQAGSWVGPNQTRFDFTHFQAVTADELLQIENTVNGWILADLPVTVQEMPVDEAKKSGAIALFGEKYGDIVRVVRMGDVRMEFCGGTHLTNTAKIGQIRLTSEFSVAAGVRRIETVTARGAIDSYRSDAAKAADEAEKLRQDIKERGKEIDKLTRVWIGALVKDIPVVPGKITAVRLDDLNGDQLKIASEHLIDKTVEAFAVVLASVNGDKINFVAAANKEAVASGIKAGDLIKKVTAATGGKGGGRPELAMGAGTDISKLDAALSEVN
ncbi:MAG: alanine--tRNA ligase [Oscillospiraceae bacterium]|jgi:alanyl-tRNA synthetase|nr:alanine--tRNA ligase [Oscillospiraceae bacterium]